MTAIGQLVLQIGDRADKQRCLAGTGARDEVEREHAGVLQPRAVGGGERVVLRQDVAFDADRPLLAHAGDMHARATIAEIDRAVGVIVLMMVVDVRMR